MNFAKMFSVGLLAGCLFGCKQPISVDPIKAAGCAIESAVSGGMGIAVASALNCSNVSAVQASLQAAFGNANLCQAPVPAPAPAAPQMSKMESPKWSKIGDVSQQDLDDAKKGMQAKAVAAKGIIGNIACPIAINSAIGFLSNSVPSAWGCSQGASAAALASALTVACEAAVPL